MTITPETIAKLDNEVQAQLFDLIVKHLAPWQVNTLADQLREYVWSQQIGRREK